MSTPQNTSRWLVSERSRHSKKAMAATMATANASAVVNLEIAQLKAAALKVTKPIIFDSGANVSIMSDITHVDINTILLCRRAKDACGVETAVGAVMPISGTGVILGLEGQTSAGASASLISVQQTCVDHHAYVCDFQFEWRFGCSEW